ncbi:hypothetical protein ACTD5D_09755 [Nocardia takedensis]|uniref:hypothetical protein n=1 Tax=Nocardia takedensis TaxID=259390 RepID=UPI003F7771ED
MTDPNASPSAGPLPTVRAAASAAGLVSALHLNAGGERLADGDTGCSRRVVEVLDFFERCPWCGYHASASAVIAADGNAVEFTVYPTCGLPCGWSGEPRSFGAPAHRPAQGRMSVVPAPSPVVTRPARLSGARPDATLTRSQEG